MTIQGKKPHPDAILKRIANTRIRPERVFIIQEDKNTHEKKTIIVRDLTPRDPNLPYTNGNQPYTHVWVVPK